MITDLVRAHATELAASQDFPAFVYDLASLREHVTAIAAALAGGPEIFYAAKANPDAPVLQTVAPRVAGIEVASGGELQHVLDAVPGARIAFGGPGKTDPELRLALDAGVERIHVESPYELQRLADMSRSGRGVDVMLRLNLPGGREGVALAMTGPFGMDPVLINDCLPILADNPHVRLRGIHAHLASGLGANAMVDQSRDILAWARPWLVAAGVDRPEFNVGGGMAVDYSHPDQRFDWTGYGEQLAQLAGPGETLRIEPGRAITVYDGWYITDVLDVKIAHGEAFAILRGGTHQFRTPVTKQHDQPFLVLPADPARNRVPVLEDQAVTLVGQLCTPKDVFARRQHIDRLAVGDLIAFQMAGAYAWNISHHDFLMHPKPTFHYLG